MADQVSRRDRAYRRRLRVGLLLIVALAIIAYAIWRIGDLFNLFVRRYEIVTLVPSAAGLLSGAPVTLAGQRVGLVKGIEFLPLGSHGKNNLSVQLSVAEKVQDYIRTDSFARIRTQGVLGDKFVDITVGSPNLPVIQPGDTIPSLSAVEFEDLLTQVANALAGVEGLIAGLREITASLSRGEGTLGELLMDPRLYEEMVGATTQIRELLGEINRADGTLGRLIRDPALYEEVRAAIARVDTLGTAILHGQGTLSKLLESDEFYQQLLGTLGRADSTLGIISGTLAEVMEGQGTIQRLLTDPALYDQFLKTVIDLQTLIEDIRANPKRFRPEVKVKIF
jgi:phospholipid/cholesterol/gamma-HCH transport system substrate-binding protein